MSNICSGCGCTESLALAHAKALGFLLEFQSGIYTCCQIAEWADEQWSAWFEATQEYGKSVENVTRPPELDEGEAVLIPVRFHRRQVPRFRNPDDLSR